MEAIIRSAIRRRGLRPAASTAAETSPKARAASVSNGRGSKVASTCWRTLIRSARSEGSAAWCGPADNSASVTALITISPGKYEASRPAKWTTTFVSIRPRSRVSPLTAERVLIDDGVDVAAQLVRVEDRGRGEGGQDLFARDEGAAPQRDQPRDRGPVAGDRERLAPLDGAH